MKRYNHTIELTRSLTLLVLLSCSLLGNSVWAAGKPVEVSEVWSKQTVQGQKVAGVYLQIRSVDGARLLEVQSPLAGSAEIHSMKMEGAVMRMRKLERVDLPAGKTVKLAPGGEHIMLFDIKQPLKPGDKVPVTLVVEQKGKRSSVSVEAVVRALEK